MISIHFSHLSESFDKFWRIYSLKNKISKRRSHCQSYSLINLEVKHDENILKSKPGYELLSQIIRYNYGMGEQFERNRNTA